MACPLMIGARVRQQPLVLYAEMHVTGRSALRPQLQHTAMMAACNFTRAGLTAWQYSLLSGFVVCSGYMWVKKGRTLCIKSRGGYLRNIYFLPPPKLGARHNMFVPFHFTLQYTTPTVESASRSSRHR